MVGWTNIRWLAAIACLGVLSMLGSGTASAQVVISQSYGGGGNSGATYKNDFIEVFNRGAVPVDLSDWSVQYQSVAGTGTWQVTPLNPSITLQPGQYLLIQQAAGTGGTTALPVPDVIGTIAMAGGNGKVALVNHTTALTGGCPVDSAIQDLLGIGTTASCFEGSGPAPGIANTTASVRNDDGCTDTDDNAADFTTAAPTPRNSASPLNVCAATASAPIVGFDSAYVSVLEGDTVANTLVFEVNFAPVIAAGETLSFDIDVSGDATRFAYSGDASVVLDDSATSPYLIEVATIPNTVTDGNSTVTLTLSNFAGTDASQADPISKQGTIIDDDLAFIPINQVQGSGAFSPYDGQSVTTRGIVTGITAAGRFYIQSQASDEDADPETSEGLYVYGLPSPAVSLAIGDLVYVSGTVSEYIPTTGSLPITELVAPVTAIKASSGHSLPVPVVLTAAELDPAGPIDALEPYEYMRVTVPRFVVTSPTGVGTNDEYFGVIEGTARPFRESGIDAFRCGVDPNIPGSIALPDEAPANVPCWDNNPELLRVKSNLLVGGSVTPLRTGTVLEGLTGVLDYSFGRYSILSRDAESATIDTSNAEAGTPVSLPTLHEVTIGGYNVENLKLAGGATYPRKADKIARTIIEYLHTPDVLGLIEVADLETLEDIADRVSAIAANDPQYDAVMLAAAGSQRLGFLIKTSLVDDQTGPRAEVIGLPVEHGAGLHVLCPDGLSYTTGLLNDRPPLQVDVEILGPNGVQWPVTVINNHLKSLIDTDSMADAGPEYACFNDPNNPGGGEGRRNRAKRQQNAEFVAELVAGLQSDDPNRAIVLVGDFNAFEFNDGYADLIGTIIGQPSANDETVVPDDGVDLVDPDLIVLTTLVDAQQRYSYTFQGNAQTLDQILTSEAAVAATVGLPRMEFARVNADFHQADALDTASAFANSDHDPALAFFDVAVFRTADLQVTAVPAATQATVGDSLTYQFSITNTGPDAAIDPRVTLQLPNGVWFTTLSEPLGWSCNVPVVGSTGVVECWIDELANAAIENFTVVVSLGPETSNQTVTASVSLTSRSTDPNVPDEAAFVTEVAALPDAIFTDGFED